MTKQGKELLTQVARIIVERADSFDMNEWYEHDAKVKPNRKAPAPYCGTVACIAGHVSILAGVRDKHLELYGQPIVKVDTLPRRIMDTFSLHDVGEMPMSDFAGKVLGLAINEQRRLFFVTNWPKKYKCLYYESATNRARARIAAQRIRSFIKTGV
jgi:hypothetical protein